jgi:hypothetical protein
MKIYYFSQKGEIFSLKVKNLLENANFIVGFPSQQYF